jgi:hypothetical protein
MQVSSPLQERQQHFSRLFGTQKPVDFSPTLTSILRAVPAVRLGARRRLAASLALVAMLVNALCPLVEAFAAPARGDANFIEICSASGTRKIAVTDDAVDSAAGKQGAGKQGAGTQGEPQDLARGRRVCDLCPVSADAQGILPPTVALHTAAYAGLPPTDESQAAFVLAQYWQTLPARGPPAGHHTTDASGAMPGARHGHHVAAALPARGHALTAFPGSPAAPHAAAASPSPFLFNQDPASPRAAAGPAFPAAPLSLFPERRGATPTPLSLTRFS